MNYWVLKAPSTKAEIAIEGGKINLSNEYISRAVDFSSATLSFYNRITETEFIENSDRRAVIVIDGCEIIPGQNISFVRTELCEVCKRLDFTNKSYTTQPVSYPPAGKAVKLYYENDRIDMVVRYEIYDLMPVIAKNVTVRNKSGGEICVNKYELDALSLRRGVSPMIYGETNYAGGCGLGNNRVASVHQDEAGFTLAFDVGPDAVLQSGEVFEGIWGYELLHMAGGYEGKMIEVKQMYRQLFPWVLHSPLIFHTLTDDPDCIREAVDHLKQVGFDMLIQSFGSAVNAESDDEEYLEEHREAYAYARENGIDIGAYTLAIVQDYREVKGDECNVFADPKTRIMRCLACEWSEKYWQSIFNFYDKTGANAIEIDGPYHFYQCEGSHTHMHRGLSDSRYWQWRLSTVEVMRKFKERDVYINAPDWLYLSGVNKCGIGYEEVAFSQPRQEQLISSRIYNYKGTFNKIPSMGWSFLPIEVYHGGGEAASFAPLEENLADYEWSVFQHIMSGVLPCFRGKYLFEGKKSKAMLKKWVSFYKCYMHILNGITVHFLPPVMDENNPQRTTGLDAILNVIPHGKERGILAVFNQTDREIRETITVPLFYSGLSSCEYIPTAKKGTGITEVKNPNYGDYPPPYPVSNDENAFTAEKVTGYGTAQVIRETGVLEYAAVKTDRKIIFSKEAHSEEILDIDSNADARLTLTLPPMSYTWYLIYEYS